AKLGHDILKAIADYTPGALDTDTKQFAAFMSIVDAFITTQSILQEAVTDDLRDGGDPATGTIPPTPAMPQPSVAPAANGDAAPRPTAPGTSKRPPPHEGPHL